MGIAPNSTVKMPQPEQVVADKYRLKYRLGQGGMGYVFLAEKLHLGTQVAVKFLDPEPNADPTRLRRFLQEARVSVEVNHPGAAQMLDAGYDEVTGALFLVFEYVEGQDVREVLNDEVRLAFGEARDICVQVAEVLAFAHSRGIVHRDVKPENIRMRRDLGGPRVKVLDFGIARLVNQGAVRLTAEGMLAGTPRYMAPEQIRDLALDGRTDVYALGLLLFEMLTGRAAFEGKNLSQLLLRQMNDPMPPLRSIDAALGHDGLDQFLKRACAKQPIERFQTMEEFVSALDSVQVTAWPSPRRKLVPGGAPAQPLSPTTVGPAPQPRPPEPTSPNQAQRDATLFVDEASARANLPQERQTTEPSTSLPVVVVPWDEEPVDASRLPTAPAREAVSRTRVEAVAAPTADARAGAQTLRPDDGVATLGPANEGRPGAQTIKTGDPSAAAFVAPASAPSAVRWWVWLIVVALFAAAIVASLWALGFFFKPMPVGQALDRGDHGYCARDVGGGVARGVAGAGRAG